MKRVTGIGGIFFKCEDPAEMKAWYKKHLGLDTDEYGTNFEWRRSDQPEMKGFTQWSPFEKSSAYFGSPDQKVMINYRVENLEALLEQLREEGVEIVDEVEEHDYGKFVHILDAEGNRVELWEPNDAAYDKIVDGRTK